MSHKYLPEHAQPALLALDLARKEASSLKFCRIAQGQADIYPRFGPTSQWDTAAGQCLLEAAGGAVLNVTGEHLRYGLQRPLLNPEFLAVGDKTIVPVINLAR